MQKVRSSFVQQRTVLMTQQNARATQPTPAQISAPNSLWDGIEQASAGDRFDNEWGGTLRCRKRLGAPSAAASEQFGAKAHRKDQGLLVDRSVMGTGKAMPGQENKDGWRQRDMDCNIASSAGIMLC
jgi:hypothetical protein